MLKGASGEGANYSALKAYVKEQLGRGQTPCGILRDALTRKLLKLNEGRIQILSGAQKTQVSESESDPVATVVAAPAESLAHNAAAA